MKLVLEARYLRALLVLNFGRIAEEDETELEFVNISDSADLTPAGEWEEEGIEEAFQGFGFGRTR